MAFFSKTAEGTIPPIDLVDVATETATFALG